jgi:hypothetical protein
MLVSKRVGSAFLDVALPHATWLKWFSEWEKDVWIGRHALRLLTHLYLPYLSAQDQIGRCQRYLAVSKIQNNSERNFAPNTYN